MSHSLGLHTGVMSTSQTNIAIIPLAHLPTSTSTSTSAPDLTTTPLESVTTHAMKVSTAAQSHTMNPIPVSSKPPAAIIPPVDPLHDLIPGYPMLAGRMGNMPEVAMFRRFGALNARSLLYYQAELAHLEDELQLLEAEDAKSKDGKKEKYTTNAFWLNTADFRPDGELRDGDKRQRDLIVHMRRILKEYSKHVPQSWNSLSKRLTQS